ncbi:MAG: hypothetical protein FWD43_01100, partial [Coriobacteriia bacterium]|nr:hypothetical protein [Coriobacteriia bacterium]
AKHASIEPFFGGLTVTLYQGWDGTTGTVVATATTGATSGAYLFDNLYPGDYTVVLTLPDGSGNDWYVTNTGKDLMANPSEISVPLSYNTASTDNIFGLTQLVDISGLVFEDKNINGVMDTGEFVIDGVTIILTPVNVGIDDLLPQESNGDGIFEFTRLAPGTYTLAFAGVPADMLVTIADEATLTLGHSTAVFNKTTQTWTLTLCSDKAGEESLVIDTGYAMKSSISGYVWQDYNNNTTKDASESYHNNLTVTLYQDWNGTTGTQIATTATDSNGVYTFDDLYPGDYTVVLTKPGVNWYVTNTGTNLLTNLPEIDVALPYDTQSTGHNFGVTPLTTLEGIVFEDTNNNGEKDGSEAAISGVVAVLNRISGGVPGFVELRSPATGSFNFPELAPGVYELSFEGIPDGELITTANGTTVTLSANEAVTAKAVFDSATETWTVTIISFTPSIEVETGYVQKHRISGTVWKDSNASGAWDTGELYFEGQTVSLFKDWGEETATLVTTTATESDGSYFFDSLYPGTYTVVLTTPDPMPTPTDPAPKAWLYTNTAGASIHVKVNHISVASNTDYVDFGLTQLMSISGRVWLEGKTSGADGTYDPDYDTLLTTTVKIKGLDPWCDYQTETDISVVDGIYVITGLIPGRYEVRFVDEAYEELVLSNSFVPYSSGDGKVSFDSDYAARKWSIQRYSGYDQKNIDFALSNMSVLRGFVWHDVNADGIRYNDLRPGHTGTEPGLENIGITIYRSTDEGLTYLPTPVTEAGFATASDGSFMISGIGIGYYKVVVTVPTTGNGWGVTNTVGYVTELIVHVDKLSQSYSANFGLVEYITIAGAVWQENDASGVYGDNPSDEYIPTHPVAVYRDGVLLKSLTTDTEGTYAITAADKVYPGSFKIVFDALAGHFVSYAAEGFDADELAWTAFTLFSGDSVVDKDCSFTPARIISGTVWHDHDANAAQDSGDEYLEGMVIRLLKKDSSGAYQSVSDVADVTTGVDGYFEFTDLVPGDYRTVVVNGDDYLRTNPASGQTYEDRYMDYVLGGNVDTIPADPSFALALPITLSGLSFIDKTSSGVYESGVDEPVSVPFTVHRDSPDATSIIDSATNGSGVHSNHAYGLPRLLPGTYTVTFYPLSGHVVSNSHTSFELATLTWTVTLTSGQTADYLDVGYARSSYLITGFVWIDENGNAVIDTGEGHFALTDGVVVTASHPVYGTVYATVGDDGRFEFELEYPGAYTISAALPGDYEVTNRAAPYDRDTDTFTVTLTYEAPVQHLDIGAALPVTVSGQLFWDINANGIWEPASGEGVLANCDIQLIGAMGYVEAQVQTNSNGEYFFPKLKPGDYTVLLPAPPSPATFFTGYNGANPPAADISSFNDHTGIWELHVASDVINASSGYHTPSQIAGTLFDETNKVLLPDHEVDLYKKNTLGDFELWMSDVTGSAGEYSFFPLTVGEYQLRVSIPEGFSKTTGSSGEQSGSVVVIGVVIDSMGQELIEQTDVVRPADDTGGTDPRRFPQTGDFFGFWLPLLLMAGALCMLGTAIWLRRPPRKSSRTTSLLK